MYKFKFADIGEGLHEAVVGEVYFKEGDKVAEGDSLFAVETDKVNSDIPSPVDGTINKILINTGDTIHVGDITLHIDDGSGDAAVAEEPEPAPNASGEAQSVEPEEEKSASVVGDIKSSNKVFSFDNAFGKKAPAPKAEAAPAAKSATPKAQPKQDTSGINLPNPDAVKPEGKGQPVDVVVIGAGPGGYDLTTRLGKQGFKTVVIEEQFAGGVCLNIGCIPTKTLLKGAKVLSYAEHAEEIGLDTDVSKIKVNWAQMQKRKNDVSSKLSKGVEFMIKGAKAEFVKGHAEIIDKHNVKVNDKVYTTKYIVVASGSRPVALNKLPGFDEGYKAGTIVDSTGALEFKAVPKSLAIVGGGVIGVEFAVLYNQLGAKVTILEGQDSLLGPMDGEVKKLALDILKDKGIDVRTGVKVTKFDKDKVIFENGGKEESLKVDKLLVSVGRIPNNLGLDKTIGLELGKRGEIVVNDIMQTNIDNVFAIGDVVGHSMLAHTAYKHSSVLAKAFKGKIQPYNRYSIPGCVYIYPEISSIGKTEEELKAEGVDYLTSSWKNIAIGRALAENDKVGFTKLLLDKKYGTILGAHIISATSSETISEIATAMELEGTVYEIADTVHPHPSTSEGIWEAATHAVEKLEKLNK